MADATSATAFLHDAAVESGLRALATMAVTSTPALQALMVPDVLPAPSPPPPLPPAPPSPSPTPPPPALPYVDGGGGVSALSAEGDGGQVWVPIVIVCLGLLGLAAGPVAWRRLKARGGAKGGE
eukprot:6354131-Prymnesium_polylepis.1